MRIPEIWQREIDAGTEFGKRAARAILGAKPSDQKPLRKLPPVVSDVGVLIRQAIESAGDYKMTCGHCVAYLRSLNYTTEHDVDTITERLLTELQIPAAKREEIGGTKEQRVWLRAIVSESLKALGPS